MVLLAAAIGVSVSAFGGADFARGFPLEVFVIPILVWSALRFGVRGFTGISLLLSGIAIWGTLLGHGPFVRSDAHASLMVTQGYVGVIGATLLMMASLVEERRHAETRLRHIQTELSRASRLSLMGEMATALAHELNQPLSAIANYVNGCLLRRKAGRLSDEELGTILEEINASTTHASETIKRIRSFIQGRASERHLVDLNAVTRQAIALVSSDADRAGVTIVFNPERYLPKVVVDEIQIAHVIVNLLINGIQAIAHSPARSGLIDVRLTQEDDWTVTCSVSDTGPGMDADAIDHVFDQFHTTKPEGLGMGLAISRSIVESHDGKLTIDSNPDEGTTARFSIAFDWAWAEPKTGKVGRPVTPAPDRPLARHTENPD